MQTDSPPQTRSSTQNITCGSAHMSLRRFVPVSFFPLLSSPLVCSALLSSLQIFMVSSFPHASSHSTDSEFRLRITRHSYHCEDVKESEQISQCNSIVDGEGWNTQCIGGERAQKSVETSGCGALEKARVHVWAWTMSKVGRKKQSEAKQE